MKKVIGAKQVETQKQEKQTIQFQIEDDYDEEFETPGNPEKMQ